MNQLNTLLRIVQLLNPVRQVSCAFRRISTYPADTEEQITVTDDGKVVVCWHPEKSFPYECTKPLPEEKRSSSIFNIESKDELYKAFKNKKIEHVREELQKITFTTKHRWFPIARSKKYRQNPMNRPYL